MAGDKSEWANSKKFYENIEGIYVAKERLRAYRGTNSYQELWEATEFERGLMAFAIATEKRLKSLRKHLKNAQARNDKAAIEHINKQIDANYVRFNRVYSKHK